MFTDHVVARRAEAVSIERVREATHARLNVPTRAQSALAHLAVVIHEVSRSRQDHATSPVASPRQWIALSHVPLAIAVRVAIHARARVTAMTKA